MLKTPDALTAPMHQYWMILHIEVLIRVCETAELIVRCYDQFCSSACELCSLIYCHHPVPAIQALPLLLACIAAMTDYIRICIEH